MKPESSKAKFGVLFTGRSTCGTQPLVSKDTYCGLGHTSNRQETRPGCRVSAFQRFPLPGPDKVSVQEPDCDQQWGVRCLLENKHFFKGLVEFGLFLSWGGRAELTVSDQRISMVLLIMLWWTCWGGRCLLKGFMWWLPTGMAAYCINCFLRKKNPPTFNIPLLLSGLADNHMQNWGYWISL